MKGAILIGAPIAVGVCWLAWLTFQTQSRLREQAQQEAAAQAAREEKRLKEVEEMRRLETEHCSPGKTETYKAWTSRTRGKDPCHIYAFNGWKSRFYRRDRSETNFRPPPPCPMLDENLCLENDKLWWERGTMHGILKNTSGRTLTRAYIEFKCIENGVVFDESNDSMFTSLAPNEKWKFGIRCYGAKGRYSAQFVELISR